MWSRRRFVRAGVSAAALSAGWFSRVFAQDRYDQDELLQFYPLGQVTLMHASDLRAQLLPHHYRPADAHVVLPDQAGQPPYLSGEDFRIRYGVGGLQPQDMAFTHQNFVELSEAYGKMGGLAHLMTLVRGIRALRPGALLLLGGSSAAGSLNADLTRFNDMRAVLEVLAPDAMTLGGEQRINAPVLAEIMRSLTCPVVGPTNAFANQAGTGDQVTPFAMLEQNGVKVAVLGQDDPFVGHSRVPPARQPRLFADRFARLQSAVTQARGQGAAVVVCLSQNGWDADRALADAVEGIDIILSGRSHVALPEPLLVGGTHIVASGGQGRFLSRIDLEVADGALKDLRYKLIPVFSDLINADTEMAEVIQATRKDHLAELTEEVGHARHLLFGRGPLQSTWDDLICEAMMAERAADIAFVPARRWGTTVLPGGVILREDIFANTALPGDVVVNEEPTWAIKASLEEAAEAVFHAEPLRRTGLDMIRTAGLQFRLDPVRPKGRRISGLALLSDGAALTAEGTYRVARTGGQAGAGLGPLQQVVERFIRRKGLVGKSVSDHVQLGP